MKKNLATYITALTVLACRRSQFNWPNIEPFQNVVKRNGTVGGTVPACHHLATSFGQGAVIRQTLSTMAYGDTCIEEASGWQSL
jgi:hypothetical protein